MSPNDYIPSKHIRVSPLKMPSSASAAITPSNDQVQTLIAGFDALQHEYHRLLTRCQTFEHSLESAKTQVC